MKTVIFVSLLVINSFTANSQSILPENPDNLMATVISATSNGLQNEWSANSDSHQFSASVSCDSQSMNLQMADAARCVCNVTVTDNSNGISTTSDVTVADCPTSSGLGSCKQYCKFMVKEANNRSGGSTTTVLNSSRCQ